VEGPVKLLRQLRHKVQAVTYGSPLYRMMLDQGPVPDRLRVSLADPWPGRAEVGQALIAGQTELFAETALAAAIDDPAHGWLRDLRAVGTDSARRRAAALLSLWLDEQDSWEEAYWAPAILGERLANWLAFHDFYAPAAPGTGFEEKLIASMVRQLRHLMRTVPVTAPGLESLRAIKGLVYGGVSLIEGERALGLALELLQRQIATEILPDGGHIGRNPALLLAVLRALIDIRSALRAVQLEVPQELAMALARLVPALKFFRHGDGGFALFNGAREGETAEIETALLLAEGKGRVLRRLPDMGYERVQNGRSLLLVDTGAPPPPLFEEDAHAGLGSFEFSIGRERLIVNCGAAPMAELAWHKALAATAAHSALTLGDRNACEILQDGGLGRGPQSVTAQRYEQEGTSFVETSHDGYEASLRAVCQRTLGLSATGDLLQGRESVAGGAGSDYALRFHLHPSVQANLVQDGRSVLLRTPSGIGWRFRIENSSGRADLGLEGSIYAGSAALRRTLQIKASGRLQGSVTTLAWSLTRERVVKARGAKSEI
jgi:uncharacterized heparinase superfamily protein